VVFTYVDGLQQGLGRLSRQGKVSVAGANWPVLLVGTGLAAILKLALVMSFIHWQQSANFCRSRTAVLGRWIWPNNIRQCENYRRPYISWRTSLCSRICCNHFFDSPWVGVDLWILRFEIGPKEADFRWFLFQKWIERECQKMGEC